MKMNKKLLGISGVALGVVLFSACTPIPDFYSTLKKVDQDSTNIIAHVSVSYHTSSSLYLAMSSDESSFKFVDQAGKEHVAKGNCNCVGVALERNASKIIQYKIPKTNLAKGVYKVYLDDETTANNYKTIEIK